MSRFDSAAAVHRIERATANELKVGDEVRAATTAALFAARFRNATAASARKPASRSHSASASASASASSSQSLQPHAAAQKAQSAAAVAAFVASSSAPACFVSRREAEHVWRALHVADAAAPV